ncbi:hypothetical protein PGTUg99_050214 [Puccinia graminis f. sp. tritici]|uniref:Uncharacterized protein n=1 Tax=Puccinia graminis f. sp. tritici TaxID=56615 RepID=A0A5B0NF85_PUCGR|nr:hypothetical protein PGTUg99_050214 [Puccinia graminis f. sp. tritici]
MGHGAQSMRAPSRIALLIGILHYPALWVDCFETSIHCLNPASSSNQTGVETSSSSSSDSCSLLINILWLVSLLCLILNELLPVFPLLTIQLLVLSPVCGLHPHSADRSQWLCLYYTPPSLAFGCLGRLETELPQPNSLAPHHSFQLTLILMASLSD